MDPARAIEILRALADGRDPVTGAVFPPDSPYQRADTVRALHAALDALSTPAAPPSRRPEPTPERQMIGKPWTPEEEDHLRASFTAGTPIKDLAETHGRTKGAITARLLRLGLLDPSTTHSPVPPKPRPAIAASQPYPLADSPPAVYPPPPTAARLSPLPPTAPVPRQPAAPQQPSAFNPPPSAPPSTRHPVPPPGELSPEDEKSLPF